MVTQVCPVNYWWWHCPGSLEEAEITGIPSRSFEPDEAHAAAQSRPRCCVSLVSSIPVASKRSLSCPYCHVRRSSSLEQAIPCQVQTHFPCQIQQRSKEISQNPKACFGQSSKCCQPDWKKMWMSPTIPVTAETAERELCFILLLSACTWRSSHWPDQAFSIVGPRILHADERSQSHASDGLR